MRVLQPGHPEVVDLWRLWMDAGRLIYAPSLLLYEVTAALHRSARAGRVGPQALAASLEELGQMNVELVADLTLARRAAELAWTLDLPAAYDAHYVALAERLGAELWTCDGQLAQRLGDRVPRLQVL
jgi:predicted nucleic acid-binding protein